MLIQTIFSPDNFVNLPTYLSTWLNFPVMIHTFHNRAERPLYLITTSLSWSVTSNGSLFNLDLLSSRNSSTTSSRNFLMQLLPLELLTTRPSNVLIRLFVCFSTCFIGTLKLVISGSSSTSTGCSEIQN